MPSHELHITFGGWYQRTTLHLTELYDFMANQSTKLALSGEKLEKAHHSLNLKSVDREVDYLEFIKATTNDGIEIRYYEDGLYVLELVSSDLDHAALRLKAYYED